MLSSPIRIKRVVSRLLMLTLITWLGSVGCVSCKANAASPDRAVAERAGEPAIETISSGSNCHSQEHCQKPEDETQSLYMEDSCHEQKQSAGPMPCCSLLSQTFNSAPKLRVVPERFVPVAVHERASAAARSTSVAPANNQLSLRDSSETYLHGCLFLI